MAGSVTAELTRLRRGLESIIGIPATEGNQVEVLRNGAEVFPAMLRAIREAETTVDLLTFQLGTGPIVQEMVAALVERALAGVRVRVLVDAIGSRRVDQALVADLRRAGVDFEWFRPITNLRLWEHENRTHRKVLVVDSRIGFAGGVNTSEEWQGDARSPEEWRDTHLRIEGPAVDGLVAAFGTDWVDANRPFCDLDDEFPEQAQAGSSAVQVVRGSDGTGWSDIANVLGALLTLARRRVRIVSAYFAPDDQFVGLLCEAADRGVDVEVLLPGRNADQRFVQLAAEAQFAKLIGTGVRVWSYQRTMIHAKIVLVDDLVACVGSANFDRRSMRLNHEIEVIVLDPEVVAVLDGQYDDDLVESELIEGPRWARRGWHQRLQEQFVRPLRGRL
ncbi:MAG: phospholipase D-like domain-containing protein [Actinomycetota bacterium]|nr:phospholipase D-like domain-containing protein [Actinomycetota bacterium]